MLQLDSKAINFKSASDLGNFKKTESKKYEKLEQESFKPDPDLN